MCTIQGVQPYRVMHTAPPYRLWFCVDFFFFFFTSFVLSKFDCETFRNSAKNKRIKSQNGLSIKNFSRRSDRGSHTIVVRVRNTPCALCMHAAHLTLRFSRVLYFRRPSGNRSAGPCDRSPDGPQSVIYNREILDVERNK